MLVRRTHTRICAAEQSVGKIVLLISGISRRSKGSIKKWCCSIEAAGLICITTRVLLRTGGWRDHTIWRAPHRKCNKRRLGSTKRPHFSLPHRWTFQTYKTQSKCLQFGLPNKLGRTQGPSEIHANTCEDALRKRAAANQRH